MAAVSVKCRLCSCYSTNLTRYVSHLRLVHSKDDVFQLTCGIMGCTEVFTTFGAFNSHIYRRHRDSLGLEAEYNQSDLEFNTPSSGEGQSSESVIAQQ